MVSHIGQIGRDRIEFTTRNPLKEGQVFDFKGKLYKADTNAVESGDKKTLFLTISESDDVLALVE